MSKKGMNKFVDEEEAYFHTDINEVNSLFEPDNIESLYRKALITWEHPEIGNAAYYKVKEQYDWSVVVKKIDELYRQLLS